jgi:YD repeat-containing protein
MRWSLRRRLIWWRRAGTCALALLMMTTTLTVVTTVHRAVAAAPAALTPPSPPAAVNPAPYLTPLTAPGPTFPTGMSVDTVWGPQGSPYVINQSFFVPSGTSLTLLPGTVVKIKSGTSDSSKGMFSVQGALYALGTPDRRVVFTSVKDDSTLGDTNGDGAATVPVRGDWGMISVGYPGAVGYFDYVDVKYGGGSGVQGDCLFGEIDSGNDTRLVVTNARLTESGTGGVSFGHRSNGYAGIFNNEFDTSACAGNSTLNYGPAVVVGNTFKAGLGTSAWQSSSDGQLFLQYNSATKPILVSSPSSPAGIDIRFNSLLGGVGPGTFPGNWYGNNINTEVLPPCMTEAQISAHVPTLIGWPSAACPADQLRPVYQATVLPALSGPPAAVPESMYEAAAARFGSVDTYRGTLSYQATDLVVQDAGRTISAARTYRSGQTVASDAGPGWSTSFSEALSTFQGVSSLTLSDGRSLPFAMDPAMGYAPAPGVVGDFSIGMTGSAITTADQTTYQFDPVGQLTGLLLGDPGHQVTVARSGGALSRVTGVSGRYLDYGRDAGRLAMVSDSQGRTATLSYTGGRLTSVSGVDGKSERYEYDTAGHLTGAIEPSGRVKLAASYDTSGRVAWVEEQGSGRSTFSYDPAGGKTTITEQTVVRWFSSTTFMAG